MTISSFLVSCPIFLLSVLLQSVRCHFPSYSLSLLVLSCNVQSSMSLLVLSCNVQSSMLAGTVWSRV